LLPFLIAGVVVIHMAVVHNDGSNNPLGISSHSDKIAFSMVLMCVYVLGAYVLAVVALSLLLLYGILLYVLVI
jgi:ubiquinol-cytochrome c reductase cytochrome b subunit